MVKIYDKKISIQYNFFLNSRYPILLCNITGYCFNWPKGHFMGHKWKRTESKCEFGFIFTISQCYLFLLNFIDLDLSITLFIAGSWRSRASKLGEWKHWQGSLYCHWSSLSYNDCVEFVHISQCSLNLQNIAYLTPYQLRRIQHVFKFSEA